MNELTKFANEPGVPKLIETEQAISTERTSISDYYNDTTQDYNSWSREGYLHFGYWRPWLNPFYRQPMLEEMNRFIFSHLRLDELGRASTPGSDAGSRNGLEPSVRSENSAGNEAASASFVAEVADLGCGVGAVSRFGSRMFPDLKFHAMTISAEQIAEAHRRHNHEQVRYYCGDYHELPFADSQFSGIFYLESLCHSTVPEAALSEAARCLASGGRIVLTDGFLMRPLDRTSPVFRTVVKSVANNWAVPMFHEIALARKWTAGGQLKLVEEIECGWRLGPSALHAAHLSLIHFFKLLISRRATAWQWKHLTASAFTIALGLYRRNFRYYLLTFEKI